MFMKSSRTVPNIDTAEKCQAECQKDSNCTVFAHKLTTKECFLKFMVGTIVVDVQFSSGPKYCPGKM